MTKFAVILFTALVSAAVAIPAEIVPAVDAATVTRTVRKADFQFGGLYVGLGYGGIGGHAAEVVNRDHRPAGDDGQHHRKGYDGHHPHGGYDGHHHHGGYCECYYDHHHGYHHY